ncbi:unnamed protein product [Cuscuta europaea]|uniref:Leucine-rich repeat-containing N-terminal plant-type domain-containing protein n=1 Tax=Cuscuta europaea TaxID=41803 RepID=A0A9P1DY30_CUSEU|nr:unnamed protein product [Cuscuta europaea]CAH9059018.1 unnamed protein product [Cuscuta europaea]
MLKGESSSLRLFLLGLLSLLHMHRVLGNVEVEALNAMKNALEDPGNVLHNWDTSLVDPCTWFRITCGQVIGEPDYKHVIQMQVLIWEFQGSLVHSFQISRTLHICSIWSFLVMQSMVRYLRSLANYQTW